MPNWCSNSIVIDGDIDTVQKVIAFLKSDISDFDFNKVIPYPERFVKRDAEKEGLGFNSGGYEWCVQNWGTKWYVTDVGVSKSNKRVIYHFDTAWSPPVPVIHELSRLFPYVRITHRYQEEGMGFSGYYIMEKAEEIEGDDGECGDFELDY